MPSTKANQEHYIERGGGEEKANYYQRRPN